MSDALAPETIDALVLSYLDGRASRGEFDQLHQAMRRDPAVLDRFVELSALDRSIQSTLLESRQIETVQHARLKSETTGESFEQMLSLLAIGSDQAELVRIESSKKTVNWKLPAMVGGAIAAVLALAVTLVVVMTGENNEANPTPGLAVASDEPSTVNPADPPAIPPTKTAVVTLTAERDAVWASQPGGDVRPGALRQGTQLSAGQRLTLTQGFAEITTRRGAVAILEAPATVEFIDSDNAVRLHAGKLTGICETPSSKGFVVRTPHMDITDIGTAFGVEVVGSQLTATVFAGEIELASPGHEAKRLVVNQTARLKVAGSQRDLSVEDRLATGFTTRLPGDPLVTSAQLNDPRFRVQVVHQGLQNNAAVHTDRTHQITGLSGAAIPSVLVGGDLIQTPADARPGYAEDTDGLQLSIDLASAADVYLLFSEGSEKTPAWLSRDYTLTNMRVRLVYVDAEVRGDGVQPGRVLQVWQRNQAAQPGTHVVAQAMTAKSAYFLVAVPAEERRHE